MGHNADGQRSQLYEDKNIADSIRDSVSLSCNLGTSWVPPKQAARLPWKGVTNLTWPGSLGTLRGTERWGRVLNLANIFLNDATGAVFPRKGTEAEKLSFCFNMYPEVSFGGSAAIITLSHCTGLIHHISLLFILQIPENRRLPMLHIDREPSGVRRIPHPLISALDAEGAEGPVEFDAVAVSAAARGRDAGIAANAMIRTGAPDFPVLAGDAVGGGGLGGNPAPAVLASPIRAAAARTTALLGAAVTSPGRYAMALFGELYNVVSAAVQSALPAPVSVGVASRDGGPASGAQQPQPMLALKLEPHSASGSAREIVRAAEAEGMRHANGDGVPRANRLVVPQGLSLSERFSLWYGVYQPAGQPVFPPLWLALYGNPGDVWGE
jgi:hypothetical protein